VGSVSSNVGSQMKQSYESFEGTKYRTIAIVKGTEFHLKAQIETETGSLTLSFIDPNGEVVYSVSNPEEVLEVKIPIVISGEYRLQVEGEHKGSYNLNWDVGMGKKLQE
jgi:hypothetical protein